MRFPKLLSAGAVALAAVISIPLASAADADPTMKLVQVDDLVVTSLKNLPASSSVDLTATVNGGSGKATLTTNDKGRVLLAFQLPDNFAGKVTVAAKSGAIQLATELNVLGTPTSTPPTTVAPAPTPTPTTVAPSTPAPAPNAPVGETVDPMTFGAKGDGTSDDTVALQAALDATTKGKTLVIPAGKTFVQTKTLKVTNDGAHISGPGTLLATNDKDSSFWIKGNDVIVDGGLVFKSNSKTRGGAWEHYRVVLWSSGTTLRNITVDGSHAAGIFMQGASNFLIDTVLVENTMADGIHNTAGTHDGVIRNATVRNVGDDGIAVVSYLADGPVAKNITIENPKIYKPSAPGRSLSVVGGENITFKNIYIEDSSAASIYISAEKEWKTAGVKNVKILGGTIKNANWYAQNDHGAILVYNSQAGGIISDVTFDGLKIDNTRANAGWNMAILDFGKGTSGVVFSNITITGKPNAFKLDGNPSAGYSFDNVTNNGVAVTK